jgi:hypothetical protein
MITGTDTVFYSTISPFDVESTILRRLKGKWQELHVVENVRDDAMLEYLFGTSRAQYDAHDEGGFSITEDGQCTFMISVRRRAKLDVRITVNEIIEPDQGGIQPEPYASRLSAQDVWEYTVVTPMPPAQCKSSRYIVDAVECCIF